MKVLITGAAGGIGAATARAFADAGHYVLRQDIVPASKMDFVGDLLDASMLETVRSVCEEEKVDAAVATHGIAGSGQIETISQEDVYRILRVNTSSVIRLHNALSTGLSERKGVFIAVSSQAGLQGEAANGVYSASKFALIGWARGVGAMDRALRMRVVCPGMTETPLLRAGLTGMAVEEGKTYEEFMASRLAHLPSGRLGRSEEIGRAILWLAELQTDATVVAAVTGGETFN